MTTAYVLLAAAVVIVGVASLAALVVCGESAAEKTALRDEIDGYRSELEQLTETVHQANRRIDSLGVATPATRPQPMVRGVPVDTTPQAAVIDRGLAAITAEVAHYGRHAYRGVKA